MKKTSDDKTLRYTIIGYFFVAVWAILWLSNNPNFEEHSDILIIFYGLVLAGMMMYAIYIFSLMAIILLGTIWSVKDTKGVAGKIGWAIMVIAALMVIISFFGKI